MARKADEGRSDRRVQVTVRVPAKVNVVLRVGPRRPDGFHSLATVFHAVSLYDEIAAQLPEDMAERKSADRPAERDVTLAVEGRYAAATPADDTNLAVRAVHALAEAAGVPPRAALSVRKDIPVAAGLAGGSADAAGALLACNELWGLQWPVARLTDVAMALGSDVPFALVGGTAIGTGRGERLEPVRLPGELHWVLALADAELSTPEVYRRLDELRAADGPDRTGGLAVDPRVLAALERAEAAALGPLLVNDLQAPAVALRPALRDTLHAGRAAGALGGVVSGSGPTCVFLARDADQAESLSGDLAASGTCRAVAAAHGPARPSLGRVWETRTCHGAP